MELWLLVLVVLIGCGTGTSNKIAFLMVDIQNCFLPGGTLAVSEGDKVIPIINQIRQDYKDYFDLMITSQDWHCSDHISFASQHNGKKPYDKMQLHYNQTGWLCQSAEVTSNHAVSCPVVTYNVPQILWPDHCIKETEDAAFSSKFVKEESDVIIRKGYNCQVDSYSVFLDNGKFESTNLKKVLDDNGITVLFIAGLARDYCVHWTSQDAIKYGYKTYVVLDATRSVNEATGNAAEKDMRKIGVNVIQSADIEKFLKEVSGSGLVASSVGVISICLFLGLRI